MIRPFSTLALSAAVAFSFVVPSLQAAGRFRVRPKVRSRLSRASGPEAKASLRSETSSSVRSRPDSVSKVGEVRRRPSESDVELANANAQRAKLEADQAAERAARLQRQAGEARLQRDLGLPRGQRSRESADIELGPDGKALHGTYELVVRDPNGGITRHAIEIENGVTRVVEGSPQLAKLSFGNFKGQLAQNGAYRNTNVGRVRASQSFSQDGSGGARSAEVFRPDGSQAGFLHQSLRADGQINRENAQQILPFDFLSGTTWPPLRQSLGGFGIFGT